MRKLIAAIIMIALSVFPIPAQSQSSNQLVTCSRLISGIGTDWTWSGSSHTCSNGNQIISRATFISWINQSTTCAGSTYSVLTYSQMKACSLGLHSSAAAAAPDTVFNCSYDVGLGRETCAFNNYDYYTVSTNASTVAPTTSAHQLSFVISASNIGGCNNSFNVTVTLFNPSSGVAQTTTGITTNTTLTYFAGGAPAGAYQWRVQDNTAATACEAAESPNNGTFSGVSSFTATHSEYY